MNTYNNVVFDPRTETFIPIKNDTHIIDKNERVVWKFTLGIQLDNENKIQSELQTKNFENAIYQITEEMTQISEGLTYNYCYGTWKNNNNNNNTIKSQIERSLSVCISVVVCVCIFLIKV